MNQAHTCAKFRSIRREGPWRQTGLLREREVESVSICRDCGRERPGRFRKIVAVEREGTRSQGGGVTISLRRLARWIVSLSRTRTEIRASGLIRRLGGIQAESEIEQLAHVAPLRLTYRRAVGTLQLHSIRALDRSSLEDIARPGVLARRTAALVEARGTLHNLVNPEAVSIRELLANSKAADFDERIIKALAAVARLLETGDVVPAKAFSAQILGNSKALSTIRRRLEKIVGSLQRLGIRDWGGLVLMAGSGALYLQSAEIRLDSLRCVGVSSEDILALQALDLPRAGILVIENLTAFQACLEHVGKGTAPLLLWSGGFPNRGVQRLLGEAARQKARIRVWCDLDLGGIRIARLIHAITSGAAEPVLMDPAIVQESKLSCPLSAESMASLRRDLEQRPDAILANTLRAILYKSQWVEQETLLDKLSLILPSN
jgi:hypothetical protein